MDHQDKIVCLCAGLFTELQNAFVCDYFFFALLNKQDIKIMHFISVSLWLSVPNICLEISSGFYQIFCFEIDICMLFLH